MRLTLEQVQRNILERIRANDGPVCGAESRGGAVCEGREAHTAEPRGDTFELFHAAEIDGRVVCWRDDYGDPNRG